MFRHSVPESNSIYLIFLINWESQQSIDNRDLLPSSSHSIVVACLVPIICLYLSFCVFCPSSLINSCLYYRHESNIYFSQQIGFLLHFRSLLLVVLLHVFHDALSRSFSKPVLHPIQVKQYFAKGRGGKCSVIYTAQKI